MGLNIGISLPGRASLSKDHEVFTVKAVVSVVLIEIGLHINTVHPCGAHLQMTVSRILRWKL